LHLHCHQRGSHWCARLSRPRLFAYRLPAGSRSRRLLCTVLAMQNPPDYACFSAGVWGARLLRPVGDPALLRGHGRGSCSRSCTPKPASSTLARVSAFVVGFACLSSQPTSTRAGEGPTTDLGSLRDYDLLLGPGLGGRYGGRRSRIREGRRAIRFFGIESVGLLQAMARNPSAVAPGLPSTSLGSFAFFAFQQFFQPVFLVLLLGFRPRPGFGPEAPHTPGMAWTAVPVHDDRVLLPH